MFPTERIRPPLTGVAGVGKVVLGPAIVLAVGALALILATGAEGDDESRGATLPAGAESAACAAPPCTIVNGYAIEGAKIDGPRFMTGLEIAEAARPASACPRAAATFAAAAVPVNGFLGPCPTGVEPKQIARVAAAAKSTGLGLGVSR